MRANLAAFMRKDRLSILLILLLFAGVSLFVYGYVSVEKAFYVWDNEFYYRFTGELFQQFNISFGAGLHYLLESLNNDYNVYYALAIQPFFYIAGTSRPVYEIALVVVYLVPFILVTALVARKLLENRARGLYWLAIGVALVVPTVLLPTLRAYPDTSSALAIALATLLYLKDPSFKRLGQLLGGGLLIGLAALLRRHFAYSVFSFYGAVGVVAVVRFAGEWRVKKGKAIRPLIRRVFQVTLGAIFALFTVTIFNPQIVAKTLVIDFNKLYGSYLVPWPQELGWLLDSFGWLPFGLAVVGLFLLWRNSTRKEEALFFALFGLFEFLLWVFYIRQISIQYTLHLSLFIVVGLTAFIYYAWQFLKTRTQPAVFRATAALGVVLIAANLLAGLVLPTGTAGEKLFSTNWQPLIRSDYQQVINLTKYLQEQAGTDHPIYVVASSYRFNSDTLLAANRMATGQAAPTLLLVSTPDIDSRDYYPLEHLLKADIVVVIDPFEYHIAPDQQQVVKVVYDMFLQNKALAQDFEVLNPGFPIDASTRAVIYRRVKAPSLVTSLEALQMIQSYVRQRPGIQYDWINLDPPNMPTFSLTDRRGTELEIDPAKFANKTGQAEMVYSWPVTGTEKFQGKISFENDNCGETALTFSAAQPATTPAQFAAFQAKPGRGQDFEVDFSKAAGPFVVLDITPPAQPGCVFKVDLDLRA
jgi:hypothetical protein